MAAEPECRAVHRDGRIDNRLKSEKGAVSRRKALPLYEYRCTACGYSFEKIQSFSAQPETVCPKCQGALVRPVTAPALRFEGAGWYVNDYAGKGGAKAGEAPAAAGAEATGADAKPETKSDSKPESKTEGATEKAAPAAATGSASPASSAPSGN